MHRSVNENSTAYLDIIFYNESDSPTTPASVEYTITDHESGDLVEEGTITPDRVVRLTLSPTVNKILDDDGKDIRVVTITAKYGDNDQHVERFMYEVNSLS